MPPICGASWKPASAYGRNVLHAADWKNVGGTQTAQNKMACAIFNVFSRTGWTKQGTDSLLAGYKRFLDDKFPEAEVSRGSLVPQPLNHQTSLVGALLGHFGRLARSYQRHPAGNLQTKGNEITPIRKASEIIDNKTAKRQH